MRANRVPAHQLPPSAPRRRPRHPSRVEPLEQRRLLSAGFLDTGFDGDGRLVRADAGTGVAVVVQSDGKVVTAGSIDGPGGNDFFLARYNPDGSADSSFGDNGTVHTDFAGRSDAAEGVALQADGKIIAVGASGREFAVARYNVDGSLDATFAPGGADGDGRVSFGFGGVGAAALDVVVQSDQQILVSGSASPTPGAGNFALARLNPDGTLDNAFGAGGTVTTGNGLTAAYAVALAPGGKIVLGGTAEGGDGDSALARYNADGSLDPTFGPLPEGEGAPPAGIVRGAFDATVDYDEIADVAVEPDGSILAAGHIATRGFTVARFSEDGFFSHKFDVPAMYSGGGGAFAKSLARLGDGRVIAAGYTTDDQERPENFAVVRFNTDGSVDPAFSLNGVAVTDFRTTGATPGGADPRDGAYALAVSPVDNSVAVAGTSQNRSALAVYHGDADASPAPAVLRGAILALTGTNAADDVRLYPADAAGQKFVADLSGSLFLVNAAQASRVTVDAGAGDDVVRALAGPAGNPFNVSIEVSAGDGNDTVVGGAANDFVRGDGGNDTLDGARGADIVLGGTGDDTLLASEMPPGGSAAGFGDDYYAGEGGNDTIDYSSRTAGVWVRLGATATGSARERDVIRGDIEKVVGGSGNDRLEGNDHANTLVGGAGGDLLIGRGGNDTLLGGEGDDTLVDGGLRGTLDGGEGIDTINGVREQGPEVTLEAEDATIVGASVGRSNPGYTGTGYVDYAHATGDYVEWTYNAPAAGQRTLTFRYANGGTTDRPLELKINGVVAVPKVSFVSTGSFSVWRTVTVTVQLAQGANKIRLTSIGSNGANIDNVKIS